MTEKYLLERDIGDGERLVVERRRWSRERERVKFGKTKKLDQSEKNKSINIAFDGKVAKGVCNIRRTV
jgi:hypothetical protein